MELDLLSTIQIAKGYNILTDLELAIMRGSKEDMDKIHDKFYKCIPHKETPMLSLIQIYLKKAIMISKIKNLSWT
uniref:PARP alpha-helical domain-containing protein n=1 Tax=viral metagenome TaxID=1070528 RepID=A0A6C0B894_9ZZZZ